MLVNPELEKLLLWYTGVPKKDLGKKAEKMAKWAKIVDEKATPPVHEKWTPENESKLEQLKKKDIKIGDTAYGRLVAGKKRELDAASAYYDKSERAGMRAKFDLMDAEEAIASEEQDGEQGSA